MTSTARGVALETGGVMMLSDRTKTTLEAARAELAELEASYRRRAKALRALIRVLEVETPQCVEPPPDEA